MHIYKSLRGVFSFMKSIELLILTLMEANPGRHLVIRSLKSSAVPYFDYTSSKILRLRILTLKSYICYVLHMGLRRIQIFLAVFCLKKYTQRANLYK